MEVSTMPRAKNVSALPPLDTQQRYDLNEAAAYLRISRPLLARRIANGTVATITDGRRRFVPGVEIARLSAPDSPAT
jgi:hypothetical protein